LPLGVKSQVAVAQHGVEGSNDHEDLRLLDLNFATLDAETDDPAENRLRAAKRTEIDLDLAADLLCPAAGASSIANFFEVADHASEHVDQSNRLSGERFERGERIDHGLGRMEISEASPCALLDEPALRGRHRSRRATTVDYANVTARDGVPLTALTGLLALRSATAVVGRQAFFHEISGHRGPSMNRVSESERSQNLIAHGVPSFSLPLHRACPEPRNLIRNEGGALVRVQKRRVAI